MEVRACSNTTTTAGQLEKELDRLVRYKTCIERTFHRSLKELKALQTNAVIQATLTESVRQNIPPLSIATQISKRTQPATNQRPPTTHHRLPTANHPPPTPS